MIRFLCALVFILPLAASEQAGTYPTKISYEISEDFETDFRNFSKGSIGETTAEEKFRKADQNGRNIDGNFSWIGSEPAPKKQKICLNMIVKDESRIIKRCLDSVKPFIDYWVIVDTGSKDGTQKIIKKHMK